MMPGPNWNPAEPDKAQLDSDPDSTESRGSRELGRDGMLLTILGRAHIHLEDVVRRRIGDDPGEIAALFGQVAVDRMDHVAGLESGFSAGVPG